MTKEEKEHELMRRELWIKTALAVAGSDTTKYWDVIIDWSNKTLSAFDENFKAMEPIDFDKQ